MLRLNKCFAIVGSQSFGKRGTMNKTFFAVCLVILVLMPTIAFADEIELSGSAEGSTDGGFESESSTTGEGSGTSGTGASESGGSSGWRLALQGRVDVFRINSVVADIEDITVPIVTPGARLLDNELFLGLGLEFSTTSDGGSKSFALSPLVNYDFLDSEHAALYGLGWLSLGTRKDGGDGNFFFGMNFGLGVRAKILESLAVGTEWGWAFQIIEDGPFIQGIFGTIMVEASLGM